MLVGRIFGPRGDAVRNLNGMLLSISIFHEKTTLHESLLPIAQSSFPLDYSVQLNAHDFDTDKLKEFTIISMIWQPAYIFEEKTKLPEHEKDSLEMQMEAISK